jgi:hypothetical protein
VEENRLWHEPAVEIYSILSTPGVCSTGNAYDLASRRWYELNIDSYFKDEDWMSALVAKHVSEYYHANQSLPPWNTINTTKTGSPITFETKPDAKVARPITAKFRYGDQPGHLLPTITFDQLRDKYYLSRAADYCSWQNRNCVFKRIEFNVDIPSHEHEIRQRETLIRAIRATREKDGSHGTGLFNMEKEIEARFNVVPVVAVVTKPDENNTGEVAQGSSSEEIVAGLLLPFAGDSLEIIASGAEDSTVSVDEWQLWDLLRGVRELNRCGVLHGDIRDWNVVIYEPETAPATSEGKERARLMLIDMGDVAPGYEGDAKAMGDLFLWCLEHSPTLTSDPEVKRRVEEAAEILGTNKDFDAALAVLSPKTS